MKPATITNLTETEVQAALIEATANMDLTGVIRALQSRQALKYLALGQKYQQSIRDVPVWESRLEWAQKALEGAESALRRAGGAKPWDARSSTPNAIPALVHAVETAKRRVDWLDAILSDVRRHPSERKQIIICYCADQHQMVSTLSQSLTARQQRAATQWSAIESEERGAGRPVPAAVAELAAA